MLDAFFLHFKVFLCHLEAPCYYSCYPLYKVNFTCVMGDVIEISPKCRRMKIDTSAHMEYQNERCWNKIITVDLHSTYFVTNVNHAECAGRRRRGKISDGVWRSRERERLLSVRLKGSEFQMVGPAYANVRCPICDHSDTGKVPWPRSAERRCCWPGTLETGWHSDDRYPDRDRVSCCPECCLLLRRDLQWGDKCIVKLYKNTMCFNELSTVQGESMACWLFDRRNA